MSQGTAAAVNDPSGDVEGGKIIAATGAEHYNVTCGNRPEASFLDIKSITWTSDAVNYTIVMEYWNAIDIGKIIAGKVWGGMYFSVNGSSIDDYQLGIGFTGPVSSWYAYETVTFASL
ncbi:MAG: hypothetical protein GYA24_24045, partial [Candidatus Lokiarchaeota archaeon]|nr:hypothetical protein [Candidatus Lokiarchaeota archaeon]